MPRRILWAVCLLGFFSSTCVAQETVYEFLRLDRSARVAALGGNSVSLKNDIVAFFQNPATLSNETHRDASFSFQKQVLDINAGFLAYGRRIDGVGDFGAGISYVNYGTFDETDNLGNKMGTFSANDLALQIGYATQLETFQDVGELRGGVVFKYIFSNISEYRSSALALDFGLLLIVPSEEMEIGFSVQHLGRQLVGYDSKTEDLPLDMRLAVTKRLEGLPLELTVGFIRLTDEADSFFGRFRNFTIGGEFTLSEAFRLRLGYNNWLRQNAKTDGSAGLAGLSAGLGIKYEQFSFDYAYSSWGVIGALHQFTIGTAL
ncbi:MAG: type IX secretion system protein PorQ [Chlorobiales bacterium]|nr:type IX secretion system protein PorQ [Chlorobiales bacterium]